MKHLKALLSLFRKKGHGMDRVGRGNGVIEISEISGHLLPIGRVQYNHLDAFEK